MATKIAGVFVDIDARLTKLDANLAKATNKFNRFDRDVRSTGSRIERTFRGLGAGLVAFAGAFAASGLISFARQSLDATGNLGELAQQLGITTDQLQVYRYAATQAGISQEEMDKGIAALTAQLGRASLGSKPLIAAFKALGIEGDDLLKSTGENLPKLADGFARIESPAQRAALAKTVFLKAGQKLLPVLEQGSAGLNEYAKAAKELGLVISSGDIQKADVAADKLAALNKVISTRFAGVVAANADSILKLAGSLNSLVGFAGKATVAWGDFVLASRQRVAQNAADGLFTDQEDRLKHLQEVADIADKRLLNRGVNTAKTAAKQRAGQIRKDLKLINDGTIKVAKEARQKLVDELAKIEGKSVVAAGVRSGGGVTLPSVNAATAAKLEKAVDPFKELGAGFDSNKLDDYFQTLEEGTARGTDAIERMGRPLEDITAEIEGPSQRAFDEWTATVEEDMARAQRVAEQFSATIESAFEEALFKGDLDGALKGLLQDMARLIIRLTVIEPLARSVASALAGGDTGGGGGFFSKLFNIGTSLASAAAGTPSGPRASGGSVMAGHSYMVGEFGRERFTPSVNGRITANDKISGAGKVQVVIAPTPYFDARVQRVSGEVVASVARPMVDMASAQTRAQVSRRPLARGRG